MVQLDSTYFEERLLDEQEQIMGVADLISYTAKPVILDQSSVGRLSRMDAMQSQAMAQAGAERQQQRLVLIEQALHRLDDDIFGRCLDCDDFIALARLELEPTSEHCIKCASLLEI